MHQRAGVKLHHGGMPNARTGRLLLRDKQDEKRIASPVNVPKTSSVTSPSVLPLPQLILRPVPAPLLNPRSMLTDVWPCGVVGDALASSKRSGKSTGLLLICLIHWPRRGKLAGTDQMRQ